MLESHQQEDKLQNGIIKKAKHINLGGKLKHCPDCWSVLREELRPKLVPSGQYPLQLKCPICDQLFPSDQEEIEHEERIKRKKDAEGDYYW